MGENYHIFVVEQQKSIALFEVLLDQAEWKAATEGWGPARWTVRSRPFTFVGCLDVAGMKSQC